MSVCDIGEYAFRECGSLQRVDLRAAHNLKALGRSAFYDCGRLKQVLFSNALETISRGCFDSSGLEEITIPSGVKFIESFAFSICLFLRQVHFAESALEVIQEHAFEASGLESFTAPSSLCEIGSRAFMSCERLK